LRCGVYRILYLIDDPRREVLVVKIAHRKDVYRA
jgi:mRNA-degrading endonuclease RelE of RelBE toxin-antitoxin system